MRSRDAFPEDGNFHLRADDGVRHPPKVGTMSSCRRMFHDPPLGATSDPARIRQGSERCVTYRRNSALTGFGMNIENTSAPTRTTAPVMSAATYPPAGTSVEANEVCAA